MRLRAVRGLHRFPVSLLVLSANLCSYRDICIPSSIPPLLCDNKIYCNRSAFQPPPSPYANLSVMDVEGDRETREKDERRECAWTRIAATFARFSAFHVPPLTKVDLRNSLIWKMFNGFLKGYMVFFLKWNAVLIYAHQLFLWSAISGFAMSSGRRCIRRCRCFFRSGL